MGKFDREALSKRIVSFYIDRSGLSKYLTCQHFKKEGVPKSTIYNVIAKYEKHGCYEDLPRSGRPPKMDDKKVKRLTKMLNNTSGLGQRFLASHFKVSLATINRVLNTKTNIKDYKKEKAPKYEDEQVPRVITGSRRMVVKLFKDKDIVMNDEKYFSLSNSNIPGNDRYYTSDKSTAPDEIKYKMKKKFEAKVLVWMAISSAGLSEAYVNRSKNAINSKV